MNIRPIRTEDDLTWALAQVEPYFLNEPKHGTPEADRFDILVGLIQGYEAQHWAVYDGPSSDEKADQDRARMARVIARMRAREGRLLEKKLHGYNRAKRKIYRFRGLRNKLSQKVG